MELFSSSLVNCVFLVGNFCVLSIRHHRPGVPRLWDQGGLLL